MKQASKWQAFRYHLFVGVTLLGCLAPWITPRYFPVHSLPAFPRVEMIRDKNIPPLSTWIGKTEIVQNAC